jgi:hypothetical protein
MKIDNNQDLNTDSSPDFSGIEIYAPSASSTVFPIQLYDPSLNDVFHVWYTGHISNLAGTNSAAAQYGTGILLHNYGDSTPDHADVVGSYDHTGGAQEMLFTRTAGSEFTQSDADEGKWLISLDATGNIGATAEIKTFLTASTVIVDGSGWDDDLASQTWGIFKHPVFIAGDGNDIEFSVDGDGKFELHSYDFTGPLVSEIELDSAANNIDGLVIKAEANGYNNIIGQRINYLSGALAAGEVGANQVIQIDDSGAADDATTQIAGSVYITGNVSDATKDAIVMLPGWTRALEVQGATAIDPDYGWETTSGTSIDRVNSAGAGDDSFINAAVNATLFDSNGDDILIGSDSTFEIVQVVLATASSKDLDFDFWYSKAGGNWTALSIQADNTLGFTQSGAIVFDAPADWTKDDEDIDGNAITDAYYIALTRTYAPVVVTLPTESFFKIFTSQELGMYIRGDGVVKLPYLSAAPSNLVDGMIWMESDGIHMYRGSTEYTVAGV